jgi:hypothetical protein
MPDGTSVLYRAAEVSEDGFTTDSLGNVYKTMPDGTSVLYRAADVAEDEFMTDSLGNVYKTMPDGSYELYRAAEVDEDIETTPPNTGGADDSETSSFEPEYFEDSLGNIYISTPNGEYELYRAAEVEEDNEVLPEGSSEPEYFEDSLGNVYVQGASGEYELYRAAEVPEDIVEEDYDLFNGSNNTDDSDYYDYTTEEVLNDDDDYYDYRRGGLITMMKNGGGIKGYSTGGKTQYNEDGSYTVTYDDGSVEMYDSEGEFISALAPTNGISEEYDSPASIFQPKKVTLGDGYGPASYDPTTGVTSNSEIEYTTDSLGNIFKNGEFYRAAEVPEDITSTGGGGRPWYEDFGNKLTSGFKDFTGISDANYDRLVGALPAAGAGALFASLLDSDFGGGENMNQGLDMSKVGVINPRTTDFGIGPTRFVGYEDYGTSGGGYTPNAELLKNLNAPGYNPVNEGDYGYEEPVKEEVPAMASGGLSSMATPVASYYTFGQPADILANLGMRAQPPMNPPEMMPQIGQQQQPQQTQQQGLPQQAPPQMAQQMPQGMPQQGIMPQQQGMPPPMRKGGLPHASNVPMVEVRMDFRQGSAVHGAGDGQSDDIPAMLADGEYVIDAETVAQIGNGSTKAGAQALDKFREGIRAHKRSAPLNKIPPKTKPLTSYLKGAK